MLSGPKLFHQQSILTQPRMKLTSVISKQKITRTWIMDIVAGLVLFKLKLYFLEYRWHTIQANYSS